MMRLRSLFYKPFVLTNSFKGDILQETIRFENEVRR